MFGEMMTPTHLTDELSRLDDIERRTMVAPQTVSDSERQELFEATMKEAATLILSCTIKNNAELCEDVREGNPCEGCKYASAIERTRIGTPAAIRAALLPENTVEK